jgi:hypothetical protein
VPKGHWASIWHETARGATEGVRSGDGEGRRLAAPDMNRPAAASATGLLRMPRMSRGEAYLELLVDVRRQRVQTSAFVATPFWVMMKGCRFGW